jgi:hemerythrin
MSPEPTCWQDPADKRQRKYPTKSCNGKFECGGAMSVNWKDSFKIGIREIDAQHHELFTRLDLLEHAIREGRGKEVIISTFQFLDNYVQLHFSAEEELQELYKYPHRDMHVTEHNIFRNRLKELENSLAIEDPTEKLAAHTNSFLTQWLITHVTSLDKELASYFSEARTRQWEKWLVSQF